VVAGDATSRKEDGVAYVDVSSLNIQLTAGQMYTIDSAEKPLLLFQIVLVFYNEPR